MEFLDKPMSYYIKAWKKCVVFKGRTSREAYWYVVLIGTMALFVFSVFSAVPFSIFFDTSSDVFSLFIKILAHIVLFPITAATWRRLHDVGKSGWLTLLFYVPFVNIWMLVLLATKSDPGHNKYGKNPEEIEKASDGDIASL